MFHYQFMLTFDDFLSVIRQNLNVSRKWRTIWRSAELAAKFCENSLKYDKYPKPNNLLVFMV